MKGIVYINDKYIEFGNLDITKPHIIVKNVDGYVYPMIDCEEFRKYVRFDNSIGYYRPLYKYGNSHKYGNGNYPYWDINKEYEASYSLNLFKDRQICKYNIDFKEAKYIPYTFGLEFETSMGYIPENECFTTGLIPLRDGSISGVEYSTVVLKGNEGLNLLKQQVETLDKYTFFNKECSLHIHFGGFPITPIHIYVLNQIFAYFQYAILDYIPKYSYNTSAYKMNKKDYCMPVDSYKNFESLYEDLVGEFYLGSLTQAHPKDIEHRAKWNIKSRYRNLNLINMLCYKNPKTVEFRFLRPTYNFKKIKLWLMILSGLLRYVEYYVENHSELTQCSYVNSNDFSNIIEYILSLFEDDSDYVKEGLQCLREVVYAQTLNNDFCGRDINIEEKILNDFREVL